MWPFKKTYEVTYNRVGLVKTTHTIFIKAWNLPDLQKRLDRREAPWDVYITSVKEM